MSAHFAFANTVAACMSREGIAPGKAHDYVGAILQGLAATAAHTPERPFSTLMTEHQTAGGLNEQVNRQMTESGSFGQLARALDAVLARIRGKRA